MENDKLRWIFGWNPKDRSFFLTKHDKTLPDDENPVFQIGIRHHEIPTADDLFILAMMTGLDIPIDFRAQLYWDKEHEQSTYFVLHYPSELISGFQTDSLTHAELLKDALVRARPDEELQIRRVTKYT
jgi:hypothetical protein